MSQLLRVHSSSSRRTASVPARARARTPLRARRPDRWGRAFAGGWPNRTDSGGTRGSTTTVRDYHRNTVPRSWAATSLAPSEARGRTSTGRMVGRPAVPHPGVRPHPSPSPKLHPGRHDVPLPRRHTGGGVATRQGGRRRTGRAARGRCRHRSPVPGGGSRRHPARRCRSDRARPRRTAVDLARGSVRPIPPRVRPPPQRRDPPCVLASVRRGDSPRAARRRARRVGAHAAISISAGSSAQASIPPASTRFSQWFARRPTPARAARRYERGTVRSECTMGPPGCQRRR